MSDNEGTSAGWILLQPARTLSAASHHLSASAVDETKRPSSGIGVDVPSSKTRISPPPLERVATAMECHQRSQRQRNAQRPAKYRDGADEPPQKKRQHEATNTTHRPPGHTHGVQTGDTVDMPEKKRTKNNLSTDTDLEISQSSDDVLLSSSVHQDGDCKAAPLPQPKSKHECIQQQHGAAKSTPLPEAKTNTVTMATHNGNDTSQYSGLPEANTDGDEETDPLQSQSGRTARTIDSDAPVPPPPLEASSILDNHNSTCDDGDSLATKSPPERIPNLLAFDQPSNANKPQLDPAFDEELQRSSNVDGSEMSPVAACAPVVNATENSNHDAGSDLFDVAESLMTLHSPREILDTQRPQKPTDEGKVMEIAENAAALSSPNADCLRCLPSIDPDADHADATKKEAVPSQGIMDQQKATSAPMKKEEVSQKPSPTHIHRSLGVFGGSDEEGESDASLSNLPHVESMPGERFLGGSFELLDECAGTLSVPDQRKQPIIRNEDLVTYHAHSQPPRRQKILPCDSAAAPSAPDHHKQPQVLNPDSNPTCWHRRKRKPVDRFTDVDWKDNSLAAALRYSNVDNEKVDILGVPVQGPHLMQRASQLLTEANTKPLPRKWTNEELSVLKKGIEKYGQKFARIAEDLPNRTAPAVATQARKYHREELSNWTAADGRDKSTQQEDTPVEGELSKYVGNNTSIQNELPIRTVDAISKRRSPLKSRARKKSGDLVDPTRSGDGDSLADSANSRRHRAAWTQEEDNLLLDGISKYRGNSQAIQGEFLPNRTVAAVRNRRSHSRIRELLKSGDEDDSRRSGEIETMPGFSNACRHPGARTREEDALLVSKHGRNKTATQSDFSPNRTVDTVDYRLSLAKSCDRNSSRDRKRIWDDGCRVPADWDSASDVASGCYQTRGLSQGADILLLNGIPEHECNSTTAVNEWLPNPTYVKMKMSRDRRKSDSDLPEDSETPAETTMAINDYKMLRQPLGFPDTGQNGMEVCRDTGGTIILSPYDASTSTSKIESEALNRGEIQADSFCRHGISHIPQLRTRGASVASDIMTLSKSSEPVSECELKREGDDAPNYRLQNRKTAPSLATLSPSTKDSSVVTICHSESSRTERGVAMKGKIAVDDDSKKARDPVPLFFNVIGDVTTVEQASDLYNRFILPDCGRWNASGTRYGEGGAKDSDTKGFHAALPEPKLQDRAAISEPTATATISCPTAGQKPDVSCDATSTVSDEEKDQIEILKDGNCVLGKVTNGIPRIKPACAEECVHYDDYYIEETAWRSAMVNASAELLPLLPPTPLPQFPNTGLCFWTFDDLSRVLLGKFVNDGVNSVVCEEDRQFLFKMMERDDVTVVTEGNAQELNPRLWNLQFMKSRLGTEFHHKFRRFTKPLPNKHIQNPTEYEEVDGYLVMKVANYIDYLEKRERLMLRKDIEELTHSDLVFAYHDADGDLNTLHLINDVVYMIDFDMVKMLPELHQDLVSKLRLPECLPGGQKCMMNAVNQNGRPFMGPNLYVTPPGSFTAVHQDGFGTVDSGHLCLSGFNEVVMIRRLPEIHKANALKILYGKTSYDALHELPHGDFLGEKPKWPTQDGIKLCREMNYCPSVFVLSAGQQVHINKGRLHAFRKLTSYPLAKNDCHQNLRMSVIKNTQVPAFLHRPCISVAWDWMYLGTSSEGVNREVISILESAAINRVFGKMSLAIPELCILELARKHSSIAMSVSNDSFLLPPQTQASSIASGEALKVLAGILPALKVVVGQHVEIANGAASSERSGVQIAKRPNSWENPQLFALDPYGNSDFFCKICSCELSNIYMHCDGCENLLHKDFNICVQCHAEEKFIAKIAMHPCQRDRKHCTINHIGNTKMNRGSHCPCKNGPVCSFCNFCLGCSCRCHRSFTMHQRLLNTDDEHAVLGLATVIVEEVQSPLPYSEEAAPRLKAAIEAAAKLKNGAGFE